MNKFDRNKQRILIVDDTLGNVELLASLLQQEGYQVRAIIDSELVLAEVKQFSADLILLDIMMPKLDGYAVCRQLKENEETSEIPVVFLSGIDSVSDKVKAFSTGGVDYITKPFQLPEVLARIETHLTIRSLQTNLQSRNEELAKALEKLKKAQSQLVQSEKMAALGQLIAGIAHEVNSPLGAIRSSVENIADFLPRIEKLMGFLQTITFEEQQIFWDLVRFSSEKHNLSSKEKRKLKKELMNSQLANLSDTESIADILVNINAYDRVTSLLPLLQEEKGLELLKVAEDFCGFQKSTQTIFTAIKRANKVVSALKNYSRQDKFGKNSLANVTEGIETVLILYRHQFKQGIEVIKNYSPVPIIACNPDELNQVWTNLIQNAVQAVKKKGSITIKIASENDKVKVEISDTGEGISEEIQHRIFEPFFTTKPSGKGSGLGLGIVKNIVEKHRGEITVESKPGETKFTVWLPINIREESFYY